MIISVKNFSIILKRKRNFIISNIFTIIQLNMELFTIGELFHKKHAVGDLPQNRNRTIRKPFNMPNRLCITV